jgi:DNA-binding transcriptional LysR family regulator
MNSDQASSPAVPGSAPQLDWNLIRAFLAVVDGGSLTAAATMLAASQPTLSRQIAELESRIGAALFERVARGLRLTAVGAALVESARRMQLAAQSLSLAALGNAQQLAGTVRITASEMTAAYLLPDILAGLRRSHPEIEIELVASNRIENLLERQADIALRHTRPAQSGLIARRLGDIRLGAFAHVDYLARVGGALELTRLQDYDWIGYDQSDALLRGFRAAGIKVGREFFRLRCDNHVVCWQLALSGAGISFAPCAVAQHWPQMQSVLPQTMVPPMPLWITAHREVRNSIRIQLVFQRLSEGFLSS